MGWEDGYIDQLNLEEGYFCSFVYTSVRLTSSLGPFSVLFPLRMMVTPCVQSSLKCIMSTLCCVCVPACHISLLLGMRAEACIYINS